MLSSEEEKQSSSSDDDSPQRDCRYREQRGWLQARTEERSWHAPRATYQRDALRATRHAPRTPEPPRHYIIHHPPSTIQHRLHTHATPAVWRQAKEEEDYVLEDNESRSSSFTSLTSRKEAQHRHSSPECRRRRLQDIEAAPAPASARPRELSRQSSGADLASRIAAGVGELIHDLMPAEIVVPAEEVTMCPDKRQDSSASERREGRSRTRSGSRSRSRSPSVPIATLIDEEFLEGSDYKVPLTHSQKKHYHDIFQINDHSNSGFLKVTA